MDFFTKLADLKINGDVQIVIRQNNNGLSVLVHMTNQKAQEGGLNIPVIRMNGTPKGIDEGFFTQLSAPVAEAINSNIDDFLTQLQANKSASLNKPGSSTTAKPATPAKPEPTAQEIRNQKFNKIIGEIDKLIEDKKFKEATGKLPKSTDWPEFISEIANKKSDINRAANDSFNLFAGSPTAAPPVLAETTEEVASTPDTEVPIIPIGQS